MVSRIDPQTNGVVATIPVGRGPLGVAVGAGAVWVANHGGDEFPSGGQGTLSKIDPHRNEVVRTISIGKDAYGEHTGPSGVVASDDALWILFPNDRLCVRIDPQGDF